MSALNIARKVLERSINEVSIDKLDHYVSKAERSLAFDGLSKEKALKRRSMMGMASIKGNIGDDPKGSLAKAWSRKNNPRGFVPGTKPVTEDQLDEVSKETKQEYVKRASSSARDMRMQGEYDSYAKANNPDLNKRGKAMVQKANKRQDIIDRVKKNLGESDEFDDVPHGRTMRTMDWQNKQSSVYAQAAARDQARKKKAYARADSETLTDRIRRKVANKVAGRQNWEVTDKQYKKQRFRAAKRLAKAVLSKQKNIKEDSLDEASVPGTHSHMAKLVSQYNNASWREHSYHMGYKKPGSAKRQEERQGAADAKASHYNNEFKKHYGHLIPKKDRAGFNLGHYDTDNPKSFAKTWLGNKKQNVKEDYIDEGRGRAILKGVGRFVSDLPAVPIGAAGGLAGSMPALGIYGSGAVKMAGAMTALGAVYGLGHAVSQGIQGYKSHMDMEKTNSRIDAERAQSMPAAKEKQIAAVDKLHSKIKKRNQKKKSK